MYGQVAHMNKAFATACVVGTFMLPTLAFAAPLTNAQVNSIIGILIAFNADSATVQSVLSALRPPAPVAPDLDNGPSLVTRHSEALSIKPDSKELQECTRVWNRSICLGSGIH